MLIMNEKKEVERFLKDINSTECKISQVLNLLIRYYINEKNMSIRESISAANKYVKTCFSGYSETEWDSYNGRIAKTAHKRPLRCIESVPITQNEIDDIKSIQDMKLQKLAFACLVIAKMNMILNNHSWITVSDRDLFWLANLKHTSKNDMNDLIYNLFIMGFISFSKRIDNTNKKYEKIDNDNNSVAYVSYLSDLGYWWHYVNGENFNICEECGRLYKPASGNQKYCFIHSATYNKPLSCTCVDCGREFQIEPGKRKRKRCECCYMERRLKQYRDSKSKR